MNISPPSNSYSFVDPLLLTLATLAIFSPPTRAIIFLALHRDQVKMSNPSPWSSPMVGPLGHYSPTPLLGAFNDSCVGIQDSGCQSTQLDGME